MPCVPFPGGIICMAGSYKHIVMAGCPWCCLCDDQTEHAFREVHGGYCAPDLICGACGQYWSADMDSLPKMSEEKREENITRVQALRDAGVTVGEWPLPSALSDYESGEQVKP